MAIYDGAFPFVWWENHPEWDGAFPLGPGYSAPTPDNEAKNWRAEILIGGEVVWSAVNAIPEQELILDVARFSGKKLLVFRIVGLP